MFRFDLEFLSIRATSSEDSVPGKTQIRRGTFISPN